LYERHLLAGSISSRSRRATRAVSSSFAALSLTRGKRGKRGEEGGRGGKSASHISITHTHTPQHSTNTASHILLKQPINHLKQPIYLFKKVFDECGFYVVGVPLLELVVFLAAFTRLS
jgi:hypothetical protein